MKSQKSSTLNWIIGAAYVSFSTWSGGSVMKVLMKKPLGYLPTNLLMLPTLFLISISHILSNPAPFQFNRICLSIFILFCYVSVFPDYSTPSIIFLLLSILLFSFPLSYFSFPFFYTQNKVQNKTQVHFQKINLHVQNL